MALKAKVTMKKNWSQNIESGMKKAVLEVAVDIDKRAKILARFLTLADNTLRTDITACICTMRLNL
jgi:hypothetical protein